MTVEQNKVVARQLVETLLTQGNMDLVDTLVAADFIPAYGRTDHQDP